MYIGMQTDTDGTISYGRVGILFYRCLSIHPWQFDNKFIKLLTLHSTTITHSKYLEFSYCIKNEYGKMNARHSEFNSDFFIFFFASTITIFENYFRKFFIFQEN